MVWVRVWGQEDVNDNNIGDDNHDTNDEAPFPHYGYLTYWPHSESRPAPADRPSCV